MDGSNADNARRAAIALRNQRRVLDERDYKLMMFMFGVLAYSTFANLVVAVVQLISAPHSITLASVALVLGVSYGMAAHQAWARKSPNWWLVGFPSALSIVVLLVNLSFSPIAWLLNLALLIAIPFRIRVQRTLASLPV